jgi:hypothetical protein
MSRQKPPVINGRIPNESDRYDLDDASKLRFLNIDPNESFQLADHYDHYPDCKWAVIEYKSRSLRNCIEQLQETTEKILDTQKNVDMAIVVSKGINKSEKHIFRKKGNLLYYKLTKKPVKVRIGASNVEVQIYYAWEVDKQYKKYKRSLIPWVSK